MNWMQRLEQILFYRLFDLGGQAVTTVQLAILLLVLIITRYTARLVRRLCEERLMRNIEPGPRYTMIRLIQYSIWVIGILIGLRVLNVNLTALAVVAGALGIGVGFGLQNLVANSVAGLVLLFERPIKISDFVTVQDIEGRVTDINFRSTTIMTNDNISIIVPNSYFIDNTVINWSHGDSRVRIHAPVGVAYGSDVELVTRTLLEVAAQTNEVLKDPEPIVWFREFGDSSLNFELLVWTNDPVRHNRLRVHLNYGIEAAFRQKGIRIPFPQRDLHIKSAPGLVGVLNQSPVTRPAAD